MHGNAEIGCNEDQLGITRKEHESSRPLRKDSGHRNFHQTSKCPQHTGRVGDHLQLSDMFAQDLGLDPLEAAIRDPHSYLPTICSIKAPHANSAESRKGT